jgi:hypothetical protein
VFFVLNSISNINFVAHMPLSDLINFFQLKIFAREKKRLEALGSDDEKRKRQVAYQHSFLPHWQSA